MLNLFKKTQLPGPEQALPGRATPMPVPALHLVTGQVLQPPFPKHLQQVLLGMGCFWGAERKLWQQPGVFTTAVGYAGGFTPNPYYEEVCSGLTGHAEVVLVVFDPLTIRFESVLKLFWESHDPTQGMRQGNDVGTQYRSVIYCQDHDQRQLAEASRKLYQSALDAAGYGVITTEIALMPHFYYAEPDHQQYLASNPQGYCGLKGLEVCIE